MSYHLDKIDTRLSRKVFVEASKSESNRVLLINALGGNKSVLHNISNARDSQTMSRLLREQSEVWDVLDAGTTMRFCTAFLAIEGKGEVITGTERMKNRPIGPLVDALRQLGASIKYLNKEGFPPLKIEGIKEQDTQHIQIPGNISSQYISALLMIAPVLPKGLHLELTTEIFSKPYILMTLELMKQFGVNHTWEGNTISVPPTEYHSGIYTVESDWSGASYWYSFISLAPDGSCLFLPALRENSLQGDQAIVQIMKDIGVKSTFNNKGVIINKTKNNKRRLTLNFKECPDLAQTVLVAAAVNNVSLEITGLESLKIKETDRVHAMQQELNKLNAKLIEIDHAHWRLSPSVTLPDKISVHTYEDHRMAMAFAPLCQLMEVEIEDPYVVNKSYPSFWEQVNRIKKRLHADNVLFRTSQFQ